MSSYLDLGFDKHLVKTMTNEDARDTPYDEIAALVPQLSGSRVRGGVITSANGALEIDLNKGTITLSNVKKQSIIFSGENNEIVINDSNNDRMLMDGNTGVFKVSREGYDVRTAANENLMMSSDFSYVRETWLPMHPQWDNSWTALNTWQYVAGSVNSINFDDWPDHTWYFEMIGKTDAGTAHYQLYNTTDAAEVAGSDLSTTSTTIVRLRTSAITKPSGTKVIKIRHKIVDGDGSTEFVNSIMSRSVFRIV